MREQSYLWTMFKHLKLLSFSPSIRQASSGTSGIVLKQRHPPECLRVKESFSCHKGKRFLFAFVFTKSKVLYGKICMYLIYI